MRINNITGNSYMVVLADILNLTSNQEHEE